MRSFRLFLSNWSHALLKSSAGDTSDHPGLPASPAWRGLYVAALFEADQERTAQRIAEARNALAVRAHELFQTSEDHLQERNDIDEAFQALHALEQCKLHLCDRRR